MKTPENTTVSIPSRWVIQKLTHEQAIQEIDQLASILVSGSVALAGLYMRICDTIRDHQLTDSEIRLALFRHFPAPRISELMRVARAPREIYIRYQAGFFGFKAALRECRGYTIHGGEWLTHRKIRRTAERLVTLMPHGEVAVLGKRVIVA